ncbi:MAG TPA: retropepsin-like aspartic protease [Croceibacterium sp.]|nr:retropepsin-like aspartic protease [Croceibacterium sp.]
MQRLTTLACLALAFAGPADAQDIARLSATGGCASVPILPAAIPVVEVTIGGRGPYKFAIDTGAQGHGRISTALAEALGLPKVGEVGTPAPGGSVASRAVYGAAEVSVGGISFKNVDLVALSTLRGPGTEWDGILGNELIKLLPLTLDYGNARARFGGPGLSEGLPIKFDSGIPLLPVEIAGQTFAVHFDSGNGAGGLFLEEAAAKALPLAGEPVERGRARTSFGDFAIMEAPLAITATVGGTPLSLNAIGWPSPRPGGNLGSKAMAGLSITIDAKSSLAVVERSAVPPRCAR